MCEWDDAVHEIVSTFWKTSYLQLRLLLFRYNISYMKAEVLLWESYLVFQDNNLELYVSILLLKEEKNASARPYETLSLASHLIQNPIQSKKSKKTNKKNLYFVISVWYRHTFHLTTFNPLVWTNPSEIKVLADFS